MKHAFFLASSGTGVGLTTVSLGLVNALDSRGVPVAFFKPISQRTDDASGLDRSTHFIRSTTGLKPQDPIPVETASLLGKPSEVQAVAKSQDVELPDNVEILDPGSSRQNYVNAMYEARKHKGLSMEMAASQLEDNVVLGTMMLALDEVDGLVSGAVHSTANTIRPALQVIKTKPNAHAVSSIFFMCLPEQVLVYGDCAVVPDPDVETLADIAIQSADSAKTFGIPPRVAMLSYSTGESGSGAYIDFQRSPGRRHRLHDCSDRNSGDSSLTKPNMERLL
jgi:BioD-like phosphotransacetylase family protein